MTSRRRRLPGALHGHRAPLGDAAIRVSDNAAFNASPPLGGVPPGSVIVAGKNLGCGSSREQAVSALKGHELTIVAGEVCEDISAKCDKSRARNRDRSRDPRFRGGRSDNQRGECPERDHGVDVRAGAPAAGPPGDHRCRGVDRVHAETPPRTGGGSRAHMNGQGAVTTKFKTFTYKTSTSWTEGKSGTISSEGKPVLKISALPNSGVSRGCGPPRTCLSGRSRCATWRRFFRSPRRNRYR